MASHGQYEISDRAERKTETPHGFPTRVAAALMILAALTFMDPMPRLTFDPVWNTPTRTEKYVPSACGAEAVARAQREGSPNRIRAEDPTVLS